MADCLPPYLYRPTFVASSVACAMDVYEETRSRSPVGLGGTFFRSKDAGEDQNLLSIEMFLARDGTYTLQVYEDGIGIETFSHGGQGVPNEGVCTPNLIDTFRTDVNTNSSYIEMPTLDYGGVPASAGGTPIFESSVDDGGCLSAFSETFLSGGTGATSTVPPVTGVPPQSQPRTGPERSLIAIVLSEIINNNSTDDGQKYEPPVNQKVRQWDGSAWISYVPNADC